MNLFAPDHFVDHAGVGLDELDDFGRDALVNVVGYGEAEVAVVVHLYGYIHGLQQRGFVNASEDKVAFVKSFRTLGGSADAYGSNGFADAQEEAAFFGQRA